MANLKELIKSFDALGWVPTIRGSLSLDLIGNGNHLLGDVDKYAVEFKRHRGHASCHYIAATSLLTVNDSKVGAGICRTFRYMFVGAISDKKLNAFFVNEYQIKDDKILDYMDKEGFLFGQLLILTETETNISKDEAKLLKLMREVVGRHEDYVKDFFIRASSMEDLESQRVSMYELWKDIFSCICAIKDDEKDARPKYCFDVLLTRDGILLLKDTTADKFRDSYCKQGSLYDYTQNVAIHRIFKVAMNYIKYLFHVNYHHNIENDAFLPVSNLHPARRCEKLDLSGVFRHQLYSFLDPITRMKRNGFADYTMDANGIILYAKSFVNVFKENNLIEPEMANKANSFIELQKQEVEHMTQTSRTLVNSILVQHNPLLIFTGVLAFVVAVVKLVTSFVVFERVHYSRLLLPEEFEKVGVFSVFVLVCFIAGYIIYYVPHYRVLSKRFVRKEQQNRILCGDSNIEKQRLSYAYQIYRWKHTLVLKLGKVWTAIFKVLLWLTIFVVVVYIVFCVCL